MTPSRKASDSDAAFAARLRRARPLPPPAPGDEWERIQAALPQTGLAPWLRRGLMVLAASGAAAALAIGFLPGPQAPRAAAPTATQAQSLETFLADAAMAMDQTQQDSVPGEMFLVLLDAGGEESF